jgi:hypothetical protein
MKYKKPALCCKQYEILVDWIQSKTRDVDEAVAIVMCINYCPYCGKKQRVGKEYK